MIIRVRRSSLVPVALFPWVRAVLLLKSNFSYYPILRQYGKEYGYVKWASKVRLSPNEMLGQKSHMKNVACDPLAINFLKNFFVNGFVNFLVE